MKLKRKFLIRSSKSFTAVLGAFASIAVPAHASIPLIGPGSATFSFEQIGGEMHARVCPDDSLISDTEGTEMCAIKPGTSEIVMSVAAFKKYLQQALYALDPSTLASDQREMLANALIDASPLLAQKKTLDGLKAKLERMEKRKKESPQDFDETRYQAEVKRVLEQMLEAQSQADRLDAVTGAQAQVTLLVDQLVKDMAGPKAPHPFRDSSDGSQLGYRLLKNLINPPACSTALTGSAPVGTACLAGDATWLVSKTDQGVRVFRDLKSGMALTPMDARGFYSQSQAGAICEGQSFLLPAAQEFTLLEQDHVRDVVPALLFHRSWTSDYRQAFGTSGQIEKLDNKESGAVVCLAGQNNGAGMQFVPIPAGTFQMGEDSFHTVTLTHAFEMQITDVTQAQWVKVMGSNPSQFKARENCPKTYREEKGIAMCPLNPVENVSWDDVQSFIGKLNTKNPDSQYRLPTEAEWEYAARAGTTTYFSFGNDENQADQYAWTSSNSGQQTHEVGGLKANPWGLYDMHGNVWQWVQDWYGESAPGSVSDPSGDPSGSYRGVRGGCWNFVVRGARSGYRNSVRPAGRYSFLGFRLVRTL